MNRDRRARALVSRWLGRALGPVRAYTNKKSNLNAADEKRSLKFETGIPVIYASRFLVTSSSALFVVVGRPTISYRNTTGPFYRRYVRIDILYIYTNNIRIE